MTLSCFFIFSVEHWFKCAMLFYLNWIMKNDYLINKLYNQKNTCIGPNMIGIPHLNPKELQRLPNSIFSSLFP
jgi:hypothetical protein